MVIIIVIGGLLCVLSVPGLINPKLVNKADNPEEFTRKSIAKYLLVPGLVLLFVGILLYPQENGSEDTKKAQNKTLSQEEKIQYKIKNIGGDYIQNVNVFTFKDGGYNVSVFYLKDSALTASTYVFTAGTDIKNISKQIINRWPQEISRFVFFVRAPTQDEYGNQGHALAMKLYYNASELKKVNWDNFTNWDMLNLVGDLEVKPLGRSMISKYCQDSSNAENSRRFCLKALR